MINRYALLTALALSVLSMHTSAEVSEELAPGYSQLKFELPIAGSYKLHPFANAQDGTVLTDSGEQTTLHQLFDDKLVVLGFIYLSCGDVNGCPLSVFVINELKNSIDNIAALKNNVRLLSLSFDPERDIPEVLKHHAHHIGAHGSLWSLITTKNEQSLLPILQNYQQPIQKIYDENGKETGEINHILRVFLIDRDKKIRNIYSTQFLHKEIVLADLKTLLLAEDPQLSFTQN